MLSRTRLRTGVRSIIGPALSHQLRRTQRRVLGNPKPKLFFSVDDTINMAAREVAQSLALAVQYAYGADVEGDIVEFGTMSGSTAQAIATSIVASEARSPHMSKRLHLFDSFEGLPEMTSAVDRASPHVKKGLWSPGGCKVLNLEDLKSLIEGIIPSGQLSIHKGWFADTVNRLAADSRFSMVHFDGDLYQSMIDALDPLFARGLLSNGAMLCFDDWNCNHASNEFGERKAWNDLVHKYDIEFSPRGDYSWGSSKLIVHNYRRY